MPSCGPCLRGEGGGGCGAKVKCSLLKSIDKRGSILSATGIKLTSLMCLLSCIKKTDLPPTYKSAVIKPFCGSNIKAIYDLNKYYEYIPSVVCLNVGWTGS